jgi:hypothetical protein
MEYVFFILCFSYLCYLRGVYIGYDRGAMHYKHNRYLGEK